MLGLPDGEKDEDDERPYNHGRDDIEDESVDGVVHGVSWSIPLPPRSRLSSSSRHGQKHSGIDTTTPLLNRTPEETFRSDAERKNATSTMAMKRVPVRRKQPYCDNELDVSASEMVNLTTSSFTTEEQELRCKQQQQQQTKRKRRRRRSGGGMSPCSRRPDGVAGYFFGFMFEEDGEELDDNEGSRVVRSHLEVDESDFDSDGGDDSTGGSWNMLNMALFVAYGLTSAATTLPVLIVPRIGQELFQNDQGIDGLDGVTEGWGGRADASSSGVDISAFISRCASCAVLGVACGKLLNAPLPDVIGARRTSSICAVLLSVPLVLLSLSSSTSSVTTACFLVEFVQSVQWPCIIVLLSAHYNLPSHKMQYESGIYLTSIASRLGSLLAVPLFSTLLRQFHWRVVCLVGAWLSIVGSSVMYLYVMDSPTETNQPQNALQPHLAQQLMAINPCKRPRSTLTTIGRVAQSVFVNNLLPSFQHVLTSWTFWIVALSHTGSSLVLSSQRILGTYFYDTSSGYLPDAQSAGSLVVFLPMGTILGLAVAGNMFAHRKGKHRKHLVTRLYVVTIVSCYALSILSIPRLRRFVDTPDLILFGQVMASLAMGFGVAVMSSAIPGLASAAFTNHRGFFTAYTDGVAYAISSIVWRVVATSVENGNAEGGGWAYGWAAVALLVVVSAILLIECWSVLPAINGRSCRLSTPSIVQV